MKVICYLSVPSELQWLVLQFNRGVALCVIQGGPAIGLCVSQVPLPWMKWNGCTRRLSRDANRLMSMSGK